jgi:hypothetical protein
LENAGTPIGPKDLLIAAHARALDLVLVTDNEREDRRVSGLAVENWVTPAARRTSSGSRRAPRRSARTRTATSHSLLGTHASR